LEGLSSSATDAYIILENHIQPLIAGDKDYLQHAEMPGIPFRLDVAGKENIGQR